ncbi:MAG: hypothetical protein PHW08_06985 [Kiritimatiellae bacterium]|nr:hypothetical protein [Kiritimatiellia bacterium]
MTAYSINYDLKAPGRNYQALYEEIKKSQQWWHFLESTWIIITPETPDQVWARLGKHIDKNDYFLIIEVKDRCQGWLPQDAWDWIHNNVPKPC